MDDDSYANISGSTDSEHFAALYMTFLTDGKGKAYWEKQYTLMQMRDAMQKTLRTVVELQRNKFGDKAEPNSLNVVTTDGSQLVAFRYRNHAVEQPPSLYYSTTAGVTLNRKYPGKFKPSAIPSEPHLCFVIPKISHRPSRRERQPKSLQGKG